eukprot:364873-Chlamydomonas_euryale.AAC.2
MSQPSLPPTHDWISAPPLVWHECFRANLTCFVGFSCGNGPALPSSYPRLELCTPSGLARALQGQPHASLASVVGMAQPSPPSIMAVSYQRQKARIDDILTARRYRRLTAGIDVVRPCRRRRHRILPRRGAVAAVHTRRVNTRRDD